MHKLRKAIMAFGALLFALNAMNAQKYDPEYIKVINERAAKIVGNMNIQEPETQKEVTQLIAGQYRSLNDIHEGRDAAIAKVESSELEKPDQERKIEKLKSKSDKAVKKLHKKYVKNLGKTLTEEQVVQVKDGMTYGVVPLTYANYLDMLPQLTEEQKKMIHDHLVEARELAMDGGSSDEKHAWFGKYKGKINNNLSAEGYDLNKESKAWHIRLEERKKNTDNQ